MIFYDRAYHLLIGSKVNITAGVLELMPLMSSPLPHMTAMKPVREREVRGRRFLFGSQYFIFQKQAINNTGQLLICHFS